ncbi:hypothetical protein K466DRAFT_603190 [Polyporus arcularius HHB13444]|uniref:TM7S3/TM198-like domain-containing protein n=1 Tax=Polyporus arcularius HHB13444 TaxID=1314778 RepID=A0A5C3P040_9APHY|nr:hypothetical protein K466DRAFT_603190 [Polyporus arcularius HHB13444]
MPVLPRLRPALLWSGLLLALLLAAPVLGQSSTGSPPPTPSVSLSLTTSSTTVTTIIHSGNRDITTTTVVPTVFSVTITPTATPSKTSSAAASATSTAPPDYTKLDTHIDGAFGALGALLILTGLPSAFLGHKNRWSSFFLVGFYTLSLVCFVLILRFGVIQAINPPNKTLRGLYVLSSGVAGVAGGGIAIFFWKAAKYFIGAWGGFAFALWLQCFRDGGLIGPLGFRWIMYIAISVVGFVLCTVPKLHYYIMLTSTAFVGATAFMLGVDCFTTAGLKEFYVWNIGFDALFTKYTQHGIKFPVTQVMQIELGMMGAVAIMGIAVQFQILKILMRKMKEIEAERKRQDEAAEARAAERLRELDAEKGEWERMHSGLPKHGRADSNFSGMPLLNKEGSPTMDPDSPMSTPRPRYQSGLSEFLAAPTSADDLERAERKGRQTPGLLPALDLGDDVESTVPDNFISKKAGSSDSKGSKPLTPAELEDLKKREELMTEIQTIRRSIDALRVESPLPNSSSSSDSRHASIPSRPLSVDLSSYLSAAPAAAHLRPPRERDPRARVQSMELSTLSRSPEIGLGFGSSIGRPTSAPLREENWDMYLHERKLFQPPSGVTPPIPTTPITSPKVPVSPAVMEALKDRQRRESALSGVDVASAVEDIPLASLPLHRKTASQGGNIPVTILPPKRPIAQPTPKAADSSSRVKTFEELVERHREKLHELQAPLTQAEKEQADISAARSRWERAKNSEKQAVAKRQAEKEKEQALKESRARKSGEGLGLGRRTASGSGGEDDKRGHRRSLSADILSNVPGAPSSRRMSTMKVEDWQRHQVDVDVPAPRPSHDRHGSSSMSRRTSGVPFPETSRERDRRRMSGALRDPVS